jgi:hypothetical protein
VTHRAERQETIEVSLEKLITDDDHIDAWRDEALDEAETSADADFWIRHTLADLT